MLTLSAEKAELKSFYDEVSYMSVRIKNMTDGKPAALIFTFALPLMIGNVFQQLYTVVDTMVVGKGLGVSALAALGAADWMNWLMLGIIQGITQGFGILMAQEFGAGKYEDLRKTIGCSIIFIICIIINFFRCTFVRRTSARTPCFETFTDAA